MLFLQWRIDTVKVILLKVYSKPKLSINKIYKCWTWTKVYLVSYELEHRFMKRVKNVLNCKRVLFSQLELFIGIWVIRRQHLELFQVKSEKKATRTSKRIQTLSVKLITKPDVCELRCNCHFRGFDYHTNAIKAVLFWRQVSWTLRAMSECLSFSEKKQSFSWSNLFPINILFKYHFYSQFYIKRLGNWGKFYQIVWSRSWVSSSVIDPNLDFKMRKVERFAKQKNIDKKYFPKEAFVLLVT